MKSAFISLLLLAIPTALASNHGSRLTRKHQARAAHAQVDQELIAKRSNLEVRDEHNHTLTKRAFSGRGTYYYTDVGLGACGQLSQNSEFTVALNTAQYGGGYPGPECFKYISISANGQTRSGIQIRDQCPTCGYGDLDLSPGLFTQFADEGAGVLAITWWFDGQEPQQPSPSPSPPPPPPPPTSTWTPPPPTSTWTPPPPPPPSSTSTSEWVEPTPSSTWSPPPPSSSSSIWSEPPSSSAAPSSSSSTIVSSSATNSTNPFAIVSSVSESATASISASASAASDASAGVGGGAQAPLVINSNLEAINGLVTNYGQIMVVAGGAA